MLKLEGSDWQCSICQVVMKRTNLYLHIEAKHIQSIGHECQQCGKFCSTLKALSVHRSKYQHRWINCQPFHKYPFLRKLKFWISGNCGLTPRVSTFEQVLWTGDFFWDEVNESSDSLVRSHMVKTEAGWQCTDCSFSGSVNVLYKHIEAEHVSVTFKCGQCHKSCKSRDALFAHRYRYHRNSSSKGPSKDGQVRLPWVWNNKDWRIIIFFLP